MSKININWKLAIQISGSIAIASGIIFNVFIA